MNYLELLKSKGIVLNKNLEARDQFLVENIKVIGGARVSEKASTKAADVMESR